MNISSYLQKIVNFDYDACLNNSSVSEMCKKYGLDSSSNWREVAQQIRNEINEIKPLTQDPAVHRVADKHILCLSSLLRIPAQFIEAEDARSNWKDHLKMTVIVDAFILTAISGLGLYGFMKNRDFDLKGLSLVVAFTTSFPTVGGLICALGSHVSSRISSYYLYKNEPKIKASLVKELDVIAAIPEPYPGSSSIERLSYYMNAERNRMNVTVEDVALDNLHDMAQLSFEYDLREVHFKEFSAKPITNQIKLEKLNNKLEPWFFEEPKKIFEESKLKQINCA